MRRPLSLLLVVPAIAGCGTVAASLPPSHPASPQRAELGWVENIGDRSARLVFAVRSLEQCRHDREAVARHIVALSTYLGHAHITDTYWYLHATPILMGQIAEAGEAMHRGQVS